MRPGSGFGIAHLDLPEEVAPMLSIAKISTAGGGGYVEYLTGVADVERDRLPVQHDDLGVLGDYFDVDGGAVAWVGRHAPVGAPSREQFERLVRGQNPLTGEDLPTGTAVRTVAAYDLTLSAPKSVSILWGVGDETMAATIEAAHDAATRRALRYIEDEALYVRSGKGGAVVEHAAGGLTGMAVRHATSRAGDPQLHTHTVVSSLVQRGDGTYSALHGKPLFALAAIAGSVYQAELRAQLSQSLGVVWEPTTKGQAEIAGIPETVLAEFSQRSAQIADALDHPATASKAARQAATLDTRTSKEGELPIGELRARWRERLDGHYLDIDFLLEYAEDQSTERGRGGWDPDAGARIAEDLEQSRGAHWHRRDAIRAWFDAAPGSAGADTVLAAADRWLGGQIELTAPRHGDAAGWVHQQITTPEIARLEERLIQQATVAANRFGDYGLTAPDVVKRGEAAGLADAQLEVLAEVCASGRQASTIIGVAGAGKTTIVATAAEAWAEAGYTTIGTSTAARTAASLIDEAGLDDGGSLAAVLGRIQRGDLILDSQSVVVVDEAGMANTRDLARLLDAVVEADAKIVTLGDPIGQLQAIGAGGAHLEMTRLPGTVTLGDTYRAHEEWERAAQVAWRAGDAEALDAYVANDRIATTTDRHEALATVLARWWEDRHPDELVENETPPTTLMLARSRRDIHELNRLARAQRIEAGEINPARQVTAHELDDDTGQIQYSWEVCAGDEVVLRRNDRDLGVINGQTGTVERVHLDRGMTVRTADGLRRLSAEYLATGGTRLGYAVTGHAAQGMTVDRAHVVGDDRIDAQWAYSTMTRGRQINDLVFYGSADDVVDLEAQVQEAMTRNGVATTAWARMRSNVTAGDIRHEQDKAADAGHRLDDDAAREAAVAAQMRRQHTRSQDTDRRRERDIDRELVREHVAA